MLRIRRFGKDRCGYNARAAIDDLQNIGLVINFGDYRLGKRGIARVILKDADGGAPF